MDWRQTIIDHPLLALLVVVPIVLTGAVIKIGVVLLTGRSSGDPDPDE
jgi:hypothetical protein